MNKKPDVTDMVLIQTTYTVLALVIINFIKRHRQIHPPFSKTHLEIDALKSQLSVETKLDVVFVSEYVEDIQLVTPD